MTNEDALNKVEESSDFSNPAIKSVINISILNDYFEDGDVVTLQTIKEKVPTFNKKATYVKVLSGGKLEKKLDVEADDFDVVALKMILLTGGTVKKKSGK